MPNGMDLPVLYLMQLRDEYLQWEKTAGVPDYTIAELTTRIDDLLFAITELETVWRSEPSQGSSSTTDPAN